MSSSERMAKSRERRKREGMSEATIWLTKDDSENLSRFMQACNIQSKQDAISAALRKAFKGQTETAI